MKCCLLDTNLLIALLWPAHQQHDLALKWFTRHRGKGWATCPFTQAGFIRIVSNPAFSRDAVRPLEAIQILSANTAAKDHKFWPDDLPATKAVAYTGARLLGHQQVTDAYLLGLAINRGARWPRWIKELRRSLRPIRQNGRRWKQLVEGIFPLASSGLGATSRTSPV